MVSDQRYRLGMEPLEEGCLGSRCEGGHARALVSILCMFYESSSVGISRMRLDKGGPSKWKFQLPGLTRARGWD